MQVQVHNNCRNAGACACRAQAPPEHRRPLRRSHKGVPERLAATPPALQRLRHALQIQE